MGILGRVQTEPHVANEGQWTQIARLQAVLPHDHTARLTDGFLAVRHVHPVDLGGVEQPLNVLLQTEDGRARGGVIGSDPLKHR